ncbi:MarR family winged helix-turn-helix transcriptional regulator [Allosphingosinicella deserti]|uniref:MarR family transcriptional regulator n=1 Tax=Allosphingosinicella deserti TaxID=2116704 RepID=A0A2P7QSG9_9SPHN|nr:MarR family transcriptional regulator [Sphingomonas deserti]PSJ40928.1 MarR family transcriptional regulator [Sphingomonas deserti]
MRERKIVKNPSRAVAPRPGALNLGRLGEFVGFRLRRVQNQLSKDFASATADRGLRAGLFSSLSLIAANPGLSQNELSREIGLDKSVTVAIVDELERSGWAVRERSETDRRRHALHATAAGEAYLEELFGILEQTENAVLHQLSPAELLLLSELLDRMYAAALHEDS